MDDHIALLIIIIIIIIIIIREEEEEINNLHGLKFNNILFKSLRITGIKFNILTFIIYCLLKA